MSEEVEIESNITTTEDAFECFQANSMYEEEEFITLSDLVSPPNELAVELPEVVLESSDLGENLPYEQNIVYENIELSEENIVKEYDKNLQQNQNNSPHQCSSLDLDSDLQINESSNRLIKNDDLLQQSKTSFNQDNSYKEDISINIQKTIVKSRRGKGRGNRNSGVNKDIDYVPEKSNSGRKRGRGRGRGRARGSGKQHDTVKNTSEPATSSNDAPIEKSSFDALSNRIKYSETTSRKHRSKKDKDIDNANVVSSTISDIYVSDIKPKRGRPRKSLKSISATEKSSDETEVTENYQSNVVMSSLKKKKGQLENSRQTFVSIVNSSEQDASLEVNATSELPADLEHNTTLNKNVINPIAFDAHLQNDIIDSSSIAVAHEEEINLDDDGDDICLSELKTKLDADMASSEISIKNNSHDEETQNSVQSDINTLLTEIATSEPIIENFDCTTISDKDDQMEIENMVTDPNIIDNSKRPSRRRTKPVFKYDDEGSEEEDPFANVELSDDEPKRKKKGRYCSDDEYVPGKKKDKTDSSSLDSDEQDNEVEDDRKSRKRKFNIFDKNGKIRSPKKRRSKNSNTSNNFNDTLVSEDIDINNIDIEESLTSSVLIKDTKDDITDFLAKKIPGTDIKIFKTKSSDSPHTQFEIPVLDQNEAKKKVETSTQTNSIQIKTAGVQTDSQYDHGMMKQVTLSSLQAEKACEFLKNVVGTTAELGELMTQKSKDFIAKKINTNHVTDTLKMDYCVKKSFLLFKLAKHNLLQMEEDLEKQYEDFLKSNNLLQYRESKKIITPQTTSKEDSDCEIVEVPTTSKPKEKAKFNSKTVFLNKELSIKIAKKSTKTEEPIKHAEKVNVKGRHTVWINDSIMVKKVTQSFLAQDSRNKKPPDYVTYEMVKQFFDNYKKERVLAICRPYTSVEWLSSNQEYICNYFITDTTDFQNTEIMDNVFSQPETVINGSANNLDIVSNTKATTSEKYITNPKTLLTICIERIQKPFQPKTLLTICIESIQKPFQPKTLLTICIENIQRPFQPKSLLTICTEIMQKQIRKENIIKFNEPFENVTSLEKDVGSVKYIYDLDFTTSSTTLVALSLKTINSTHLEVDSLMSLCIMKVNNLINHTKTKPKQKLIISDKESVPIYKTMSKGKIKCFQAKCLSTLCFKKIQKYFLPHYNETTNSVNSLKHITMQHINNSFLSKHKNNIQNKKSVYIEENMLNINDSMTMTINCISTVTDEDFSNIEQPDCLNSPNDDDDDVGDNDNDCSSFVNDNYNSDTEYGEYQHTEESNWVSKVQMQELSLCIWPSSENRNEIQEDHNEIVNALSEPCAIQQIKLEPLEVDNINIEEVKTEPADITDEATIPSASILAKQEYIENMSENLSDNRPHTAKEGISSFDVNIFESFVSSNKIMKDINSRNMLHNEEIFSQSSQRIRRQYDPDSDEENLNTFDSMGLLIPQSIEQAKDQLMEKSSDDDENQLENISKKKVGRRKVPKKVIKDSSKEKPAIIVNEVTVLTRRMKEKIRREEKRNESSDSDTDIPLQTRGEKQLDKIKSNEKKSEKLMKLQEKVQKSSENENLISVPGGLEKEIQCSDVDSTEFITPDANKPESYNTKLRKSRKDQCTAESINLQEDNSKERRSSSSNPNPKVPAELLECEPDISIENEMISENKKIGRREKTSAKVNKSNQLEFIERNGWKCYNINHSDSKLYDNVSVILEKLPESFVDTYLRFQDISGTNQNDSEVERLTNLNTLHRQLSKDKNCIKAKEKSGVNKNNKVITGDNPNEEHLDNTDHYTELTASEDEDEATEDMSKPECHQNVDNSLAKNLLMDDNDSDSEGNIRIKQEPGIETTKDSETRNGLKSKTKVNKAIDNPDVMLTADIMMNKELTLLHTPVILNKQEEIPVDDKETKTPLTKSSSRSRRKKQRQDTEKGEDDSSSEEEKQWVNTKEKMLKRMEKKQEVTNVDEAKGAKRVSEFIEKRSDGPESRQRPQRGRRRSQKKLLEKRKQMKILAKELFGEMVSGKRSSQAYSKGRRNIRKVIDKKSLARDTVRANMQEFERKQRLSHRQAQLREHLGCEEAVNVVVINDELCLEYDFDKNLPNVSVHPYFTKVMKAHQYEGVKFMWDACFESVEAVSGGRSGGGCILAHCMGLGKTLQVLALLHTVLTNPMLNMQRVLVCCPLSTVLNWVDEIHKWIGPVTNQIKVFELSKLKKTYERAYQLEDWYSGGGIFIIGYELFRNLSTLDPDIDDIRPTIVKKIRTALLDPGPDVVVCDEGHLLKNDSSILAVAMSRVATKRRIVLTGTPMQNNLREYYCMVNFVKPHLLGTYFEYSNRFENPIMNGQHRDSSEEDIKLMKTRTHILHKVLEGCLQRQEASVLYPYLPKKYEYTVFIPLTKCQREMYTHYLDSYASKGKQSVLKDFHTLQKVWTHPQVLHNFQTKARETENKKIKAEKIEDDLAHEDITAFEDVKPMQTEVWWLQYLEGGNMLESLESSNKFQVVFKLLDECVALGDKVLIFSTSLYTMDTLEYFLRRINKWSLGQEYYRLDGSVPAEVRQKWCREFNAPNNHKTRLFLISTRAGSLGLNMTAANRVIILDTSWNPAHDIQSIFRVYRFGQKKDCFIYRLVAMGTMEQKIYERSVTKQAVSCRVVDEQQIDRHYNSAELTELYSLDEDGWGLLAGVATGVHDTALLRAAACGALHAVREHDSLLRGSEPALPEHERAAAWQQFQLEHADKHEAHNVIAAQQLDQQNAAVDVKPSTSAIQSLGCDPSPAPGKSKRGKKLAGGQVQPEQPEQLEQPEQPEQQPNPEEDTDKEESLVKKIMQILIAHNFHEPVHLNEITSLIVNVRKLVESGMSEGFTINDPIAANIASVLLQEQRSSAGLPPLPDIANNTSVREDLIISDATSDVTSVSSDTNTSRRRRFSRRAALKAEQQFDAIVDRDDMSIDGKDTEWDAGDKNKKKSNSKLKQKEKETPPADEMTQINIENMSTGVSTECSILISDDEAVEPPVSTQLEEKKKTIKSNAKRNRKRLIETPSPIEDVSEEVPLHTSLLADENFIKIVAHTYLNGNPMLAEDAALMAAQYSTSKALREYEETGAPIVRGPIYDIAVKVLGKNLLKKMHMNNVKTLSEATKLVNANSTSTIVTVNANVHAPNANVHAPNANVHAPNANVHASNANVHAPNANVHAPNVNVHAPNAIVHAPNAIVHAPNASAQAPVVLDDDDDIQVVKPPIVKMTKPGPKSRRKQLLSPESDAPVIERPPSPQPEPQNVFPVGMFIGLGEPAQETAHIEECILPDDDDDDIIMKPASPQTLPPVSNRALPKIKLSKSLPRIQPIISIDNGAISVPVCENIIVTAAPVTIPQPIAVVETAVGVNPTNCNKQQPPIESICLSDSDEEPAASASAPERPLPNTIIGPSQTTKIPSQTPIIIQSTNFKGNSPYVLSPAVKNILDPTKKYYCIPSSSLPPHLQSTNINPPNTIVPDTNSPSVSVQPQSNTLLLQQLLKPSTIAITSPGKVKPIVGTPQNINPPVLEPIQNRTQTRPNSVIEKGFLSNLRPGDLIEIKSSGGVEILKKVPGKKSQPTETVEMKSKLMPSGEVNMPTTSTVNSRPLPTNSKKCASDTNKNDAPTSSNKGGRKSPGPSDDPMSIFKNVIHIQAPSYSDKINKTPIANKTIPDKRPTKSEQTKNVLKSIIQKDYKKKFDLLLNKSNSTKSAIAITKKTTTLSTKKSAVSITLDLTGPGSSSDDDKKKRKLELLKRLEKAKWANVSKMSVYDSRGLLTTTDKYRGQSGSSRSNTSTQTSSSRSNTSSQSGPSRSNTSSQSGSTRKDVKTKPITAKDIPSKSKPASSLIDLTQGFSILKPKEDTKRPSPWSEPAIKKPKRLQTLEDFDLDDIEDITELE